jgi:hypothetical protein
LFPLLTAKVGVCRVRPWKTSGGKTPESTEINQQPQSQSRVTGRDPAIRGRIIAGMNRMIPVIRTILRLNLTIQVLPRKLLVVKVLIKVQRARAAAGKVPDQAALWARVVAADGDAAGGVGCNFAIAACRVEEGIAAGIAAAGTKGPLRGSKAGIPMEKARSHTATLRPMRIFRRTSVPRCSRLGLKLTASAKRWKAFCVIWRMSPSNSPEQNTKRMSPRQKSSNCATHCAACIDKNGAVRNHLPAGLEKQSFQDS